MKLPSIQSELIASYSDSTPRFNEDLIFNKNDKAGVIEYLTDICKTLEFFEFIRLKEIVYIDKEDEIPLEPVEPIDISRVDLVILRFNIDYKGEQKEVEKKVYLPKLIDNFFYNINGVKYFPIYQIVDKGVFMTTKVYSLKTLFMPLRLAFSKKEHKPFNDIFSEVTPSYPANKFFSSANKLSSLKFKLNLFKKPSNFLYYFLAEFGLRKTIRYFGLSPRKEVLVMKVSDPKSLKKDKENLWFELGKNKNYFLKVPFELFSTIESYQVYFISSLISILSKEFLRTGFEEADFWKRRLGSIFTKSTNAISSKAEKVLISFKRVLDENTKKQLDTVSDKDKEDTFAIVRWMIKTYDEHKYQDNLNLSNKRIRCWEYILNPLLEHFSASIYRILNAKNPTIRTIENIFSNVHPYFFLSRIIVNELVRYTDSVNTIDLFTAGLKFTMKGKGGLANGSDISDKYRNIHPSFIGNIGLVSTSMGDPGLTGCIVPYAKLDNGKFINILCSPKK